MNILNLPKEEVEKKKKEYLENGDDKLDVLFRIGRDYMTKYGTKEVNIHSKEGQEKIRQILFAMTEETFEFANVLKNKSWCAEEYPVDEEHATEEMCDMLAFMVQLFLMLGYDSNKLMDTYFRKLVVNEFRLRSNY